MRFYNCLAVCLLVGLIPASTALTASLCDQTFTIHGKTSGDNAMLFWSVVLGGDCEPIVRGFVLVLGDTTTPVLTTQRWGMDWVQRIFNDISEEKSIKIEETDGRYVINDTVWIEPPAEDTTFLRKFQTVIKHGCRGPKDWYCECPVNCSDYPIVHGCEADIVYAYEGGVYKSYSFKDVLYYPESGYLVVISDQPVKAVGLDTMHGMLVLRLKTNEDGE